MSYAGSSPYGRKEINTSGLGDDLMEDIAESEDESTAADDDGHVFLFQAAFAQASRRGQAERLLRFLEGVSRSGHVALEETRHTVAPPPPPPPLPLTLFTAASPASDAGSDGSNDSGVHSRSDSGASTFAAMLAGKAAKLNAADNVRINAVRLSKTCVPPPPSPPPPPPPPLLSEAPSKSLPQLAVPQPSSKLKTFAWHKLAPSKVSAANAADSNLWLKAADSLRLGHSTRPDFGKLEALFRLAEPGADAADADARKEPSPERRRAKETVNLLSRQRSLNVNIFLRQFKSGAGPLLSSIAAFSGEELGAEGLRGLVKVLPEKEELLSLAAYTGDSAKLGPAEQFYRGLIAVPDYAVRVEALLLRSELVPSVESARGGLGRALEAARVLLGCPELTEVLTLVLVAGNFLNSGREGGNAGGFAVSSLWKIVELRGNRPGLTLLHFLAEEAEEKRPRLLQMPTRLACLEKAAQEPLEGLRSDVHALRERAKRLEKDPATACLPGMTAFLQEARTELESVWALVASVEAARVELAGFFCEDAGSFRLEEAFRLFHAFAARFAAAVRDNADRRQREERERQRGLERQRGGSLRGFRSLPRSSDGDVGRTRPAAVAAAAGLRLRTQPLESPSMDEMEGGELVAVLSQRRASIDEAGLDRWRCWGSSIRRSGPGSLARRQRPSIIQVGGEWAERERTVSWRERVARLLGEEEGDSSADPATADRSREESPPTPTATPPCPQGFARRSRRSETPTARLAEGEDLAGFLSSLAASKAAHEGRPEERTSIDDVLAHCERSKAEIDRIAVPTAASASSPSPGDSPAISDGDKDSLNHDEGFETESRGSSSHEAPAPKPKAPALPSYLAPTKAALSRRGSPAATPSPSRTPRARPAKAPPAKPAQASPRLERQPALTPRQRAQARMQAAAQSQSPTTTRPKVPPARVPSFAKRQPAPATTSKRWERLLSPPKRLTQPTSTTATTGSCLPKKAAAASTRGGWRN